MAEPESGNTAPAPPVQLSTVVTQLVRRTYDDLASLADKLPLKDDTARKEALSKYFKSARIQFIRLYVLLCWSSNRHVMERAGEMLRFLDEQDGSFRNAADELHRIQTQYMFHSKIPSFDVATAIDVLSEGTCTHLPTHIGAPHALLDLPAPKPTISGSQITDLKNRLNTIIQVKLLRTRIPNALQIVKIEGGMLHLLSKDEFSCSVTLLDGDEEGKPWTLVSLELFVSPHDNSGRSFLGKTEASYVMKLAQESLGNSRSQTPIADMYSVIHSFCMMMQLDILNTQADAIIRSKSAFKLIKVSATADEVSLQYWPDKEGRCSTLKFSNKPGRSELRVEHVPTLTDPATGEAAKLRVNPTKVNLESVLMAARGLHMHSRLINLRQKLNPSQWTVDLVNTSDVSSISLDIALFDHYSLKIRVDSCSGHYILTDVENIVESNIITRLTDQVNQNPDSINQAVFAIGLRVLQHALKQAAHDAGFHASDNPLPNHASGFVAPTAEELTKLDPGLTISQPSRASLTSKSFVLFLHYENASLSQHVIVVKVDASGSGGLNEPKVSHWLLRLKFATIDQPVAPTTPKPASTTPGGPVTPKTPATPLAAPAPTPSVWKIVVHPANGSVLDFVDLSALSSIDDLEDDEAGKPLPTGPVMKKRKRIDDDFVLGDSKKTKLSEPTTPSTPGSALAVVTLPPSALLFVSMASIADACKSKISQALLLDQLTSASIPYTEVYGREGAAEDIVSKYRIQVPISPMLINEVFLTIYTPESPYMWEVTLLEAQNFIATGSGYHREQTSHGCIQYSPNDLKWTFSYTKVNSTCFTKDFLESDLAGVSTMIQYAAQMLRLKEDLSLQALMVSFEMRSVGLLQFSVDYLETPDYPVEVLVSWTGDSFCPISISMSSGDFPLCGVIAQTMVERRDILVLFKTLINTSPSLRIIHSWLSGDYLRMNDFTLIPCDISRIHLRTKHRYGSAIVFDIRFLGEGLISIDLLTEAKNAQFFSPYRGTSVRLAQAAKLDKLVMRAIREYHQLPVLSGNVVDDTPGQGETWMVNNSNGYVFHHMYLGHLLAILQPYAAAVSIITFQSHPKPNLSAKNEFICTVQTWVHKPEPGVPPPIVDREFSAHLEIDDAGEMKLSTSLANVADPTKLHINAEDLHILTELFNTRVKTNPFRSPAFSAFAHIMQSPPHFLHEFLKIIRLSDGLKKKGDQFQLEVPFFGGYLGDYRGILNEGARTRIGFTTLWKFPADGSSIAIPVVWNYKTNTVDLPPTEAVAPDAKIVLGATIDEPGALRQIINDTTLRAQARSPSELIYKILEWWQRRFQL